MKSLQTMSGWGMFDTITMPDGRVIPLEEAEQNQITASNEYRAAQVYSTGLWITKTALSWALPAYPRRIDNNVSDWARQNGIDNMTDAFYDFTDTVIWDPEYLKLVEEAVGEDIYDPWNYAMASWWQLRVNRVLDGLDPNTEEGWDGGSFLPFTIGSFEDAGDSTQKRANFRSLWTGRLSGISTRRMGTPPTPRSISQRVCSLRHARRVRLHGPLHRKVLPRHAHEEGL